MGITNPAELWAQQKAKLKLVYPHLHDEDLHYDYGKKDVMMSTLEKKLGKSRKELDLLLSELE
jgi:hypothetical protein